jgi:hypothetical protein
MWKSWKESVRPHKTSKVEYESKYPGHPLIDAETAAKCVPTEETKKKTSEAVSVSNKKRWTEDPDRCKAQLKEAHDHLGQEGRKVLSEKAKKQWQDPTFRNTVIAAVSASSARRWVEDRDSMLEISASGGRARRIDRPPMEITEFMVVCKICGFACHMLHKHVRQTHDLSPQEYQDRYGSLFNTDWAKERSNKRFDQPGAREHQAAVLAAVNRTDGMRAKSRENAESLNQRIATDPEFKAKCDQAKREGWTDEVRASYGDISSALRTEEWTDEERRRKGVEAARQSMLKRWDEDREGMLEIWMANRAKTDYSAVAKENWKNDDGTMLAAAMRNLYESRCIEYNGAWFRSTWEVSYVKLLDSQELEWFYEPHYFPYVFEGSQHNYFPDFWIPSWDCFVEIHPERFMDAQMDAKIAAVRAEGCHIEVIMVNPLSLQI